MRKRWLLLGVVVIVVVGGILLALPLVQGNCQNWYHRVDFLADRKVESRYGTDLSRLEKRLGRDRALDVRDETWRAAIEEIGAKPFYCN